MAYCQDWVSWKDIECFWWNQSTDYINRQETLGAAIGNMMFIKEYVSLKVIEWNDQVHYLSKMAISHPHEAYAAFTHDMREHWTYLVRTIPDISHLLYPLEEVSHQKFLLALTGQPTFNVHMRKLMSLRIHACGLDISNPSEIALV